MNYYHSYGPEKRPKNALWIPIKEKKTPRFPAKNTKSKNEKMKKINNV